MARGPLPKPDARRRNKPTIPTTELPATGRKGRAPKLPPGYELGDAGKAWWRWAWKLPQAAAWDEGALYFAARRAKLEDDIVSTPPEVSGKLMKEARELDNRLGLNPKALADLRWKIVDKPDEDASPETAKKLPTQRRHLRAVG